MMFRKDRFVVRTLSLFLILSLLSFPVYGQTLDNVSLQQQTSSSKKQTQQQYIPSLLDEPGKREIKPDLQETQQAAPADLLIQTIRVHVLGDVAYPGVQKIKMTERAAEILKLASPNRAETRQIQIRRPGAETKYYDLYQYYYFGNLAHNPYVQEGDTVFVPRSKGAIRIEGPVSRPGTYELNYEKNLDQIIRLSGGFTSSLSRTEPVKVIRYHDMGNKEVLTVSAQENDLKSFSIQKGDIIIVPDVVTANKTFDYSVESVPGENFVYPTSVPDVFVVGAVLQPGAYPYKSHLLVKDYVGFAGASGDASLKSVHITRDGKKERFKLGDQVQAGDIIVVKQKASKDVTTYVSIASALVSAALSAVVIREYSK